MNSNIADIELKKEFYLQKRNAEEGYFEATDHQKDKHKPYPVLMNKAQRKEPLRDYQHTNKQFEEKVLQGTNTLQHWQKFTNYGKNNYLPPQPYPPSVEGTVLNKFVQNSKANYDPQGQKTNLSAFEEDNGSAFLNNFAKKR
jgi:hypothetical protein